MLSTMQDGPLTIGSILRFGTTYFGDSEVVTAAEGGGRRRRSYAEVGARAARLASALLEIGLNPGDRVGTFMWNNAEHLEAYLAVPSMGAVLHTLNIRLFPRQLIYIANHAADRVLIVDSTLASELAAMLPEMRTVHTVLVTGDGDYSALEASGKQVLSYESVLAATAVRQDWQRDVDERSAAAMCYTSGTTGNPKGVVYSHRSCWLHAMSILTANHNGGLSWNDRTMPIVPMFHANAWGTPYAALCSGAGLVMPDRFMSPEALVSLIESEKVTVSAAVPTIWTGILEFLRARPGHDISSLRSILCGGSAVPRALIDAFEQETGVAMVQGWGMTETSPVAAVAVPPRGVSGEQARAYRATTGRTLFGVESRIVGDDGGELPRDGKSVGELEVRGPWVTASYYQDEEPDKFHDGWLRTGDVGTLDAAGYIMLTDRSKDVIKSGGEWISSVELEGHLMAHPAVLEAAVIGVPDDKWQERPLAAIVVKPGSSVRPEDLIEHLSARVAKWWVPERWTFLDSVPKTSVGKFDKKVLRSEHSAGRYDVSIVHARPS